LDDAPKFVVSSKQRALDWKNSTLIVAKSDEDLAREINALKQTKGGDIVIFGGASFSQSLVRLDLVDEYRFKLEAAAVSGGVPLFNNLGSTRKFKLIESKTFDPGVVMLYYQPERSK
jgi:dihydrofolate reductase